MENLFFIPVYGIIQDIEPAVESCCQVMVMIQTENGLEQLVITPDTYVIHEVRLRPGMRIAGFYDGNAPAPFIFPPRHYALVIGKNRPGETITIDYFDESLVGVNSSLQLSPGITTEILTSNGQVFSCELSNQYLIVYYNSTTRSIPPQTVPRRIIVM